jgi:nicotinamidase-related amidase
MRENPALSPRSTALLVIDLQGSLSQQTFPRTTDDVVASAIGLIAAAHDVGIKVIYIRAGNESDGEDWIFAATEDDRPRRVWRPDDMIIDARVEPREGDLVITKRQWGSFYDSGLELQLRRRGLDTIVLCGIATNFAVESTARDGWERGFRVLFAEDAMAGLGPGDHEFAFSRIFPRLGRILSTAQLIQIMHSATENSEK